jgi:O-antigen/teichoic acid export membrane protein
MESGRALSTITSAAAAKNFAFATTPADRSLHPPVIMLQRFAHFRASQHHLYTVVRSAVQVMAIRVVGAGLTYASMVLLARWLGAHDFGIYAYVFVIVTLLGLAFSFGFNNSALRFVSSYLARRRSRRLAGFLRRSYSIVFGFSVLGALLSAGLILAFRSSIEPYYLMPLLVGLVCVPLWTLLNQLEATARAFGWVNLAYVPGYVLRPLLLISLVGSLLLFVGTADAVDALWAMIGACALAALAQGMLVYFGIRPHLLKVKPAFHTRHWFTVSSSFLMIDGFRMLLDNTDVLLIGRLLDPNSVAVYFAAIRTAGLVAFVSFSIIALAVPKFAELHSTGTRQELQELVSNVIQLIFWPSLAAAIVLAVVGPYVLSLFGAGFESGYPTMLVVLTGLVLRSATIPVEYLLTMTGYHRDTMCVYGFAAVVNVGLNLLLIPAYGIFGAAVATYTAMLGGNVCLFLLVRKRLGVNASIVTWGAKPKSYLPASS